MRGPILRKVSDAANWVGAKHRRAVALCIGWLCAMIAARLLPVEDLCGVISGQHQGMLDL